MDKERIRIEIKQLQDRLNILSNELEKSENEGALNIRKPQLKERYYIIGYSGVDTCMNTNDNWEERLFESGNYWFTKEEAEFEVNQEKFTRLFKKYVKEHSEPMDSRYIKLQRFYGRWDVENQTIEITNHTGYIDAFQIYGSSKEVIQDAIKFVGEDNFKKYILQVKCEKDNIILNIDKPRREGNFVFFGSYPQSDKNKKEPIKWQILEEKDDELLLLSDKILDSKRFDPDDNNYETSEIHDWLNNDFINIAFNDSQKDIIVTSDIVTKKHKGSKLRTKDKIFLLSMEESEKYFFGNDKLRIKQGTKFAENAGLWVDDKGNSNWWLRSPHYDNTCDVWLVYYDGDTNPYNGVNFSNYGVVPALRIKSSDVS